MSQAVEEVKHFALQEWAQYVTIHVSSTMGGHWLRRKVSLLCSLLLGGKVVVDSLKKSRSSPKLGTQADLQGSFEEGSANL